MAQKFCLPREIVDDLKQAMKQTNIFQMSSAERREFFSAFANDVEAKDINTLFESKLILKNKKAGLKRWIDSLDKVPAEVKRGMEARIEKLESKGVLDPVSEESFLQDLAQDKLGIGVSVDEAKEIANLSRKISEFPKPQPGDKTNVDLGFAKLKLQEYLDKITPKKDEGIIAKAGGALKTLRAVADLSAPLRQGRAYMHTKEWRSAGKRMLAYGKDGEAYRKLQAEILGDPDYETMRKAGLSMTALGDTSDKAEEQFMKSWISNLPIVTHSDRAYTGFLTDLRVNRFKRIVNGIRELGGELDEKALKDLAVTINSATGRGDLGTFERAAGSLGNAIWSPRLFKSRLDVLAPILNPKFWTKELNPVARKEALKAYSTMAGTSAAIMGLATMIPGVAAEFNPLSSDFGKIKIGSKKIDTLGGYGVTFRAATQALSGRYKSSSGDIKKLNTDEFGSRTTLDVIVDLVRGKQAPLVGVVSDLVTGKDFEGNETRDSIETALNTLVKNLPPLIASDLATLYREEGPKGLLYIIPPFFGAGIQTYGGPSSKETKIVKNIGIDQRNSIEKIVGLPVEPTPELKPLISRMVKEDVTIKKPGSTTTIKPPGDKESRTMTDKELKEYQRIYQSNLLKNMLRNKDSLTGMTSEGFEKRIDTIKRQTTEQSKNDLIRRMIK